ELPRIVPKKTRLREVGRGRIVATRTLTAMGADVLAGHSSSPPDVASGSASAAPRRRRRFGRFAVCTLRVLLAAGARGYERQRSALQVYLLPRYPAKVSYKLAEGPSQSITFPRSAPFDDR